MVVMQLKEIILESLQVFQALPLQIKILLIMVNISLILHTLMVWLWDKRMHLTLFQISTICLTLLLVSPANFRMLAILIFLISRMERLCSLVNMYYLFLKSASILTH